MTTLSTDKAVAARQRMERAIVRALVKDALAKGYAIDVDDGGEELALQGSRSFKAVLDALMNTDEDYLILRRFDDNGAQIAKGWVRLVYGNDGWDVICDYSVNIEDLIEGGASALAAKYEARA